MSLLTVKGEVSYCMATNTATTGTEQSLYLRVCCVNSNLGQTVQIRESNRKKIIVCPSIRLRLCSALGKQICNVAITVQEYMYNVLLTIIIIITNLSSRRL